MPDTPLFEGGPVAMLRAPVRPAAHRLVPLPSAEGPPRAADAERLLAAAVADRSLMAALELASPDLVRALERPREKGPALLRRALAVHRYARRAASRPTPFGVFAGVTTARFGDQTKVVWSPEHRPVARVDVGVLARFAHALERDPAVLRHLRVQTHQLVERHGDRLHMPNPTNPDLDPGERGRATASVRLTAPVATACGLARLPLPAADLVAALRDRFPRANEAGVWRMIGGLVAEQMLLTDLRPRLGPADPLAEMLEVLARVDAAHGSRAGDPEIRDRLTALAAVTAALPEVSPDEVTWLLRSVRRDANAYANCAVHVDLGLGHRVELPRAVADEAARAAEVLWRLTPPLLGTPALREYHGEFVERYGLGRLVPIGELLDADRGLGAPAGYSWPPSPRGTGETDDSPGPRPQPIQQALTESLCEAVRARRREVVLDEALLARLTEKEHDPATAPSGFELYAHLVAADPAALDRGDFRLVISPNPGSHLAGATFSRFRDVLPDPDDLTAFVEDDPSGLPVSVRYAPLHARSGNIARDPAWTGARVTVGVCETPGDTTEELPLAEIAVGATLQGLYAVHAPTGRLLRPVALNMLNSQTQAPNAARLLCELGFEHRQMWGPWDWSTLGVAPFQPRVRYGRTVLWSATWSLEGIRAEAADPERFGAALARWRRDWEVPRTVLATSNDQRVHLDLEDAWDVELLRNELRRGVSLVAQEPPGGEDRPDGWFGPGDGSAYVAELVLPVRRTATVPEPPGAVWSPRVSRPRAAFPGRDWLYAKVHMAPERSDAFVRDRLAPLVREAFATGGLDRWFFIRYTDPGFHLRLRFHGDPDVLHGPVLKLLNERMLAWHESGLAGRLTLDGYEPELERYGGPEAMTEAERFFQADSEAVSGLLNAARDHAIDPLRLAAVGVTDLVHVWGAPGEAADLAAVEPRWRGDPVAAWLSTSGSRHEVPPGFRQDRHRRAALLDPAGGWAALRERPWGPPVLDLLGRRHAALTAYRDRLRELRRRDEAWAPESRVVGSLLHMHCNRLLGAGGPDAESDAMTLARACALHHAERRRHLREER